jgi:TRAP-type C4-dicarboxylate transport system permease small subunit
MDTTETPAPANDVPAPRPVHRLSRALDPLAGLSLALACVALVGMVLAQAWQVFARYVLNASPGWTEPVALVLMSVAVMLGATVAVRRESHFAFNGLVQSASPAIQGALKTLSRLLILVSGLGLAWLGGQLMVDDWAVSMAGAPLPAGLRFAALCFGGLLIALFALERLITGDFVAPAEAEEV